MARRKASRFQKHRPSLWPPFIRISFLLLLLSLVVLAFGFPDIVSYLKRYDVQFPLDQIARLLEQLAQRDLLVKQRGSDVSKYTFRMELVRRWFLDHGAFEEILSLYPSTNKLRYFPGQL